MFPIAAACCDVSDNQFECEPYIEWEDAFNCRGNLSCSETVTTSFTKTEETSRTDETNVKFGADFKKSLGYEMEIPGALKFSSTVSASMGFSVGLDWKSTESKNSENTTKSSVTVTANNCDGTVKRLSVYCGSTKVQAKHFVCYNGVY